jgi:metal-responsive CopG/Arc/MetJ family transcriptional regulator
MHIMKIADALQPDDLAELDRVCRQQHVSRPDAVREAVRWYIEREGDLPPVYDPASEEFEP